jgi:hypothetical protein
MRARPVAGLLRKTELYGSRLVEMVVGIKVIFVLSCVDTSHLFFLISSSKQELQGGSAGAKRNGSERAWVHTGLFANFYGLLGFIMTAKSSTKRIYN